MSGYQERVIEERNQLADRHSKLAQFILVNETFAKMGKADQDLLIRQERVMHEYILILDQRIAGF